MSFSSKTDGADVYSGQQQREEATGVGEGEHVLDSGRRRPDMFVSPPARHQWKAVSGSFNHGRRWLGWAAQWLPGQY